MYRKQILINFATNGIGLAAAEALVALGANVTIVGRNGTRKRIAAAQVDAARRRGAMVDTFIADLSAPASVRKSDLSQRGSSIGFHKRPRRLNFL
jgi:NAD(P)-dependent dehydrogenase (short-subunit alcohol dehydrogenase family)